MIWTAFATAGGLLKKVPREVWLVLAVFALLWWWGSARYDQGYDDRTAEYAAAAAQAVVQARKADAVAVDTAQAGKASVEEGNDRAQEAARNSDDPLRAGLDSLR